MKKLLQFLTAPAFSFDDAQSFRCFSVLVFVLSGIFVAFGVSLIYGALAMQSMTLGIVMLCSFATAWVLPQWALHSARVGR